MNSIKYFLTLIAFYSFPVFFLYSSNINNVSVYQIILPLIISIFSCIFFYLILRLAAYNIKFVKSYFNIILILFSILFLYYGHLHLYIHSSNNFTILLFSKNINLGSHKYLLPIVILSFLCLFYFLKNISIDRVKTKFFQIVLFLLIFQQLINISFSIINEKRKISIRNNHFKTTSQYPDIYYIILDAYASDYTLINDFKFNNDSFYDYLLKKNFTLPAYSRSNYPFTRFSLPSSLNYNYLDSLNCSNSDDLYNKISYNKASEFLISKGYTYIYFNTGFGFKKSNNTYEIGYKQNSILESTSDNSFLNLFFSTTLFTLIYNYVSFIENDYYRNKVLFAFEKLYDIPKIPNSKFVFLHLILPHPPFIFKKNGTKQKSVPSNLDTIEVKKQYLEQLEFVNEKIKIAIDNIIKNSNRMPIIILQSDHGISYDNSFLIGNKKGIKSRFYILNAIYGPKNITSKFYKGASPVNTFRLIFNNLFNSKFSILKDKSFIVSDNPPYKYLDISYFLNN